MTGLDVQYTEKVRYVAPGSSQEKRDHSHSPAGVSVFHSFATNPGAPGLARRMVERGVRFINLYHASWDHHSNLNKELSFNCEMAERGVRLET